MCAVCYTSTHVIQMRHTQLLLGPIIPDHMIPGPAIASVHRTYIGYRTYSGGGISRDL